MFPKIKMFCSNFLASADLCSATGLVASLYDFLFSGGLRDFRLMTKTSGESKGCGFLEFDNVLSQQVNLLSLLNTACSKHA